MANMGVPEKKISPYFYAAVIGCIVAMPILMPRTAEPTMAMSLLSVIFLKRTMNISVLPIFQTISLRLKKHQACSTNRKI